MTVQYARILGMTESVEDEHVNGTSSTGHEGMDLEE